MNKKEKIVKRRSLFKLAGVAAAVAVTPVSKLIADTKVKSIENRRSGKTVLIIGGGFGGLTVAKELRKKDKSIEVTIIEKKDIFMSCPFSNSYLGGLDDVGLDTLTHDYYSASVKHGYSFVQAEVTQIDRKNQHITTTNGNFTYDILVLSPGIAYDWEKQFPTWSKEKVADVAHSCPAALMPGSEHLALKRQLENMDDGNVIIVPPAKGKYRCPPAPFERTSMIANYMKNEEIRGKVIVLDTRDGKFSKGAAFQESWRDIFPDIIEYKGLTEVIDVDTKVKIVTYIEYQNKKDYIGTTKTLKYQVCNLIPINKCSPVVKMAGVAVNESGYAVMDGYSFRSKTDQNIYVVGDAVSHKIPPSGQTAIWGAKRAAGQIADQVNGRKSDFKANLPARAANVCFSMVSGKPEEAIMVTHTFSADPSGVLKGKGTVPKSQDGSGKFRSKSTAKLTREWFSGVKRELFS